jgi:TonB-linked SusC/RagA family outer membrane protein
MKKLSLVSLCLLVLCITQAFAQNRTITGTVTAKDDGLPLPGVSVTVAGTQTGTQTNGRGQYSISVPANAKSISFSFIGYSKQTVPLGSANVINAVLESSASQLSEVVVTGVGVATQKTRVAIDVASVSNKELAKTATASVDQALIGQVAGAQVIQQSGKPGSGAQVILRGFTNLSSTNPLIMLDGVQVSDDVLDNIDPSIVDHIEIVKGSAGGMLYGARGGNGVIQVFTKKGSADHKMTIDFSSKYGRDQVLQRFPLVAKYHHYDTNAQGQILDSDGNPITMDIHGIWTSPQEEDYSADPTVQNNKPYNMPVYDHTKQGYRIANDFSNTLNIRGGSEKMDYAFGVSNLQQQDVFSNTFNRTNLTMNLGFNLVKGLTFRNSAQLIYTHENLLNGSRFNLVNSYPFINFDYVDPTTGLKTVKPSVDIDGQNSLTEADYHTRYSNTPRLLETANLNYKFPKFLELDYKQSIDYSIGDSYDYWKNQTDTYQQIPWGPINGEVLDQYSNNRYTYGIASAFLRFDLKNDFHSRIPLKFTTQASYDYAKTDYRYYYLQGTGVTPYPPQNVTGSTSITGGDANDSHSLTYGFLVNQTIDFGNLFGISGGFRSDYSSVFGGQSKPFTFPRGTVYFNPSELFTGRTLVSNWKLRAAYGEAGVMPGVYDRQLTLNLGTLGGGSYISNQSVSRNANLQVQVTKELEVGSDLTLTPLTGNWLYQVNLSGSYWRRTSNDDIQNAPAPPSTGFPAVLDNLVSLKSNGVDLSLDAKTYKSENFTWDLGLRFATSRTTVTKVSKDIPFYAGAFAVKEGQPLGVLWGQTPLHSIDQLMPNGTRYIAASDASNYTLVDGNVVDKRTYRAVLTASNDLSNIGNTNPTFTSSMFNRFTIYKKLGVSFQFDWIHGNKIYNQTRQWLYRDRLSRDFDKPVTIDGKTGSFVNYYDSYYNALSPVSWFVEDGSFIRLRDVSVSYDFTSAVNQKWLKSLILTVSGRNLLTFTKYTGLDPETTGSLDNQGNPIGGIGNFRGVDDYGQPNVKTYQFTLNVGF